MNHILVAGSLAFGLVVGLSPAVHGASPVCDAYLELRFDEALKAADTLLSSDASVPDKVEGAKCQACTYVALRDLDAAKASITHLLTLDPSAAFSPEFNYPPPVLELYHAVRDEMGAPAADIRTVAVGDFEDNSVYTGGSKDYDFSKFERVLVHTLSADLAQATPLKVVDRARIQTVLQEVQLSQSGMVDAQEAVKFGQLLGAQSYIFGQYVILNKDTVRIDARVVHTATGEIVHTAEVTGKFSGKPEKFLELEKELVEGLIAGIQEILGDEGASLGDDAGTYFSAKQKSIKKREDYVKAKFLAADALELEDAGQIAEAMDVWRKVLAADPQNEVAGIRLEVLATMPMN